MDASDAGKGERPHVLATAGGGADGFDMLETFLEAATEASWRATIVAGPECPPARARRLESLAADAGATFRGFVPSRTGSEPGTQKIDPRVPVARSPERWQHRLHAHPH